VTHDAAPTARQEGRLAGFRDAKGTLAPANGRRISGDRDRVSPHRQHDAEALTLATSLLPDRHKEDPLFTEPGASLYCLNCDRESWIGRLDLGLTPL